MVSPSIISLYILTIVLFTQINANLKFLSYISKVLGHYELRTGIGEDAINYDVVIDLSYDFLWVTPGKLGAYESVTKTTKSIKNKTYQLSQIEGKLTFPPIYEIGIDNYPVFLDIYNRIEEYDSIGLSYDYNKTFLTSLLPIMKEQELITSMYFYIQHINNYLAKIYFGSMPYENILEYSTFCNVDKDIKKWGCYIDSIILGNITSSLKVFNSNQYAIFSTNDELIYAPSTIISFLNKTLFHSFIKDKICEYNNEGNYNQFQCKCEDVHQMINLSLVINGYIYEFNHTNLFLHYMNRCHFLIVENINNANQWILGITFLDNYDLKFDYEKSIVEFFSDKEMKLFTFNRNNKCLISIIYCFIVVILFGIIFNIITKNKII